ncbi:MAG: transcription antitermination protein NusB [Alphaproteobacteria bacterium]|nr:MAG: transcription antitermination protein NusB [Alphaproteobacteria bacterium]
MIDNIRHKSIRKKTASRIAAIQILYLHEFNDQPLFESISTYELHYKKFLLEKLDIKELDTNLLSDLLENFDKNTNVYDTIIKQNLSKDWKIGRLGKNELNILRLSIFELKFFKKFDKKTIINEYVSLFNNFCGEPDFANGFLNNVLKSE